MVQIGPPKKNFGSQIGQSLGMGLQSGIAQQLQQNRMQGQLKFENELGMQSNQQKMLLEHALTSKRSNQMKDQLVKLGIPENIADLYSNATEGGKTAILQNLLDLENRGLLGEGMFGAQQKRQPKKDQNQDEFEFPDLSDDVGLKPNERVTREGKREATNIPLYNESKERFRNLFQEGLSLERLNQLNQSEKLPQGLGRLNINMKSGELILPFLSSPEAQLFIKTINDFTTKAKDSYGARVTNFELDRFMKRLPTLLNSPEGRQVVIDQMKTINDLNRLDEESLIKTYDQYGVGKLNAQEASRISSLYKKEKEKELLDRYKTLDGQLNSIAPKKSEKESNNKPSLQEIFG